MNEFLKDCVECYFIIKRQREKEIFPEKTINTLIQFISKTRYNLGEMIENYKIYERNFYDKQKSNKSLLNSNISYGNRALINKNIINDIDMKIESIFYLIIL